MNGDGKIDLLVSRMDLEETDENKDIIHGEIVVYEIPRSEEFK